VAISYARGTPVGPGSRVILKTGPCDVDKEESRVVRTGSWTGPPRRERASKVGIRSTAFGVRGVRLSHTMY